MANEKLVNDMCEAYATWDYDRSEGNGDGEKSSELRQKFEALQRRVLRRMA